MVIYTSAEYFEILCSFQKIICRIHVSECWKSHKPITSTATSKCFNFCRIFTCFLSEWLPGYNTLLFRLTWTRFYWSPVATLPQSHLLTRPTHASVTCWMVDGRGREGKGDQLDGCLYCGQIYDWLIDSIKPIYTQRHYPYDVHAITFKICWCKKYLHVLSVYSANQWLSSIPIVYPFDNYMFRSAIWRRSAKKVTHTDRN